jgi:hypothetical protein
MTDEKKLVTRNECRKMGLNYCNTHFLRLEEAGLLTPIKVNGPFSRVHYLVAQVRGLIAGKPRK